MSLTEDKENNLIAFEVEDEGFLAAGRTIPFPAPPSTTIVALTQAQCSLAKEGLIKTMTILGDSLEGAGIYDGDKVVVKKAFHKREIGPKTICIVYIPSTGEICGKRVRLGEGHITLQSCNHHVAPVHYRPDDVEIRGIVIGLHRTPNSDGRFDRGYDLGDIPF